MEQQLSLFDVRDVYKPLASRMRPERLEDFAGQKQLLGERGVLRRMIEEDRIPSMIFWGPPGVGENHSGRDYCRQNPCPVYQLQRRHQRNQRD